MNRIIKPVSILLFTIAFTGCLNNTDERSLTFAYEKFYASIESDINPDTRVFADADYHVLWNADDRISIFKYDNINTEYRFDGNDGDKNGTFSVVGEPSSSSASDSFSSVYAVYPYSASTSREGEEILTVDFPAEQIWADMSFGREANILVSAGNDNNLYFRNAGGVLRLKIYGTGAVASIVLKGNEGELLAGRATITMEAGGVPSVNMAQGASETLTLICSEPVLLDSDIERPSEFWFVIPPVSFSSGITVSLVGADGTVATKTTSNKITVGRSSIASMAPFEASLDRCIPPDNEIWYTSSSGIAVSPRSTASLGVNLISNDYSDGFGRLVFDGPLSFINNSMFSATSMKTVQLPNSIVKIGNSSFQHCGSLEEVRTPDNLQEIGWPFLYCKNLTRFIGKHTSADGRLIILSGKADAYAPCGLSAYTIPDGVTCIGSAFVYCLDLTSVHIPSSVVDVQYEAFLGCRNLQSFTGSSTSPDGRFIIIDKELKAFAQNGVSECIVPPDVVSIAAGVFESCPILKKIIVHKNVKSIGKKAFYGNSGLQSVTIMAAEPPKGAESMFNSDSECVIMVPQSSLDAYKTAPFWSDYADRIQPYHEQVDMGLSVKWAEYNLGAAKPSEFGNYYAWAEVEPRTFFTIKNYKWSTELGEYTKYYPDTPIIADMVLWPEDDAASYLWGNGWRMPTKEELEELCDDSVCSISHTERDGVEGVEFTSRINGNTLFFPSCGYRSDDNVLYLNQGHYWSSTINLETNVAYSMLFYSIGQSSVGTKVRYQGLPIRPVHD